MAKGLPPPKKWDTQQFDSSPEYGQTDKRLKPGAGTGGTVGPAGMSEERPTPKGSIGKNPRTIDPRKRK